MSMPITLYPDANRRSTACDPTKPAQPVMMTVDGLALIGRFIGFESGFVGSGGSAVNLPSAKESDRPAVGDPRCRRRFLVSLGD